MGSTSCDELCVVVFEEVVVDLEVVGCGVCEDGVVGFEVVLVEEGLVAGGNDV